jgi:hypothetical protein
MLEQSATVECPIHATSASCAIRVRYAEVPGTLTRADFADSGFDCHLVQVQPSPDLGTMEVHFTGCRPNLKDLLRVLDLHAIEDESDLLSAFSGEYRKAGLYVGKTREHLDKETLTVLLRQTGRPVEFT